MNTSLTPTTTLMATMIAFFVAKDVLAAVMNPVHDAP